MTPYYQDSACTIYHGDCREILHSVQADLLVTDPPYGIALANPWALAFTRSGKDPKNCTLVELRMRRRVEGIEAARHKAVRDEERLYAAGTP